MTAELISPKTFRLVESEPPRPAPGHVRVRVEAVGICGSDLHAYAEGCVGDTSCRYPMVLGHEPAGYIDAVGEGVSGWSRGDRVACEPALYCYHCEMCRSGRHNVCERIRFMSMPGEPGYLREFVALPAANLIGAPPGVSSGEATLIEPLAVVLHSMRFVNLRPGESAVVFGGGPIGLLTVACLRLAGAGRIWCVEPQAHRRELARAMGADATLDSAADPVGEIQRDTARRGADVAIDCAAKDDTVNQCFHSVRNAGRVVITGIPSELRLPLEFSPMRRKELAIYNVRRSNHESEAARDLLAAHLARFAALITHTHPLERTQQAFDQAYGYTEGAGKVLVEP